MSAKEFQTKSNNTFERQWVKKFNTLLTEMKARAKELSDKEKKLNKRREECLHFLELENQTPPFVQRLQRYSQI